MFKHNVKQGYAEINVGGKDHDGYELSDVSSRQIGVDKVKLSEDGVSHIRIHIDAYTELGRRLSEFYPRSFTVEGYAEFSHLLGYSLYLRTGCKHSRFRHLSPKDCLKYIRCIRGVWAADFEIEYRKGLQASLLADPELITMLKDSTLPLLIYNEKPGDVIGYKAIAGRFYEEYRKSLQTVSDH